MVFFRPMAAGDRPPSGGVALKVLYEAATLVFTTITVGGPLTLLALALRELSGSMPWWAMTFLAPVWFAAFLALFSLALLGLRLIAPRLEPGHYAPGHRAWTAWGLHFILRRLWAQPLWAGVLMTSPVLRTLSLRALGARVALDINTAMDTMFTDPSLLRIDRGAMVSGGCIVAGHFVENGMLLLGVTHIGEGAQVLSSCMIGPGVTVGPHAVLAPECRLGPGAAIGANAHVGYGCQVSGGVKIGEDVVIGHQVTLEPNVVLEDGAIVPSHTLVPRGTRVAAGEKFKPAR